MAIYHPTTGDNMNMQESLMAVSESIRDYFNDLPVRGGSLITYLGYSGSFLWQPDMVGPPQLEHVIGSLANSVDFQLGFVPHIKNGVAVLPSGVSSVNIKFDTPFHSTPSISTQMVHGRTYLSIWPSLVVSSSSGDGFTITRGGSTQLSTAYKFIWIAHMKIASP